MKQIFYAVAVLITATVTQTRAQLPVLELEEFSEGYTMPVDIANAGDSRLFIVEQPGKIWVCDTAGTKSAQPFLDITDRVFNEGSEQGLLGLAFHPDYANNGYFYVNYTNLDANDQVSRFSVSNNDPNIADPNSEMVMLNILDPFPNHNGGCMKFGPKDGYLYISFGDGGRGGDPFNNAQNISVLLGKILRLDVDGAEPYAIPSTNPFINQAGAAPEIWAMGLRNPFRFSFDRQTGDLWIGDVGQNKWEEVDLQRANSPGGENYGWDCTEGHHLFPLSDCNANLDLTGPIVDYPTMALTAQ
jgi:glucose/arabinose dehydrogenase